MNGKALRRLKLSKFGTQESDRKPSGLYGWALIFLFATAYDVYAIKTDKIETLSRAFWKCSKHPVGGLVTSAIWSAISYHLVIDNQIRHILKEEF